MLNVVLFEPEIPQNTGNIMRSCVAFNATLHLIKPYGFSLDEKHLRRAGLDYIKHLNYKEYNNLKEFLSSIDKDSKLIVLSRYADKSPKEINFNNLEKEEKKIYLIFGKESTGLPYQFILANFKDSYRIPTTDKVRSINLSNSVAIMLYLATANSYNENLITHEPESLKGKDFIKEVNNE